MTQLQTSMTPQEAKGAAGFYQDFLDAASRYVLNGELARFADLVSLPFLMRTSEAETVIETIKDLKADTINVTNNLKTQGVTDYIRLVQKARFLNVDIIEGWHVSYLLRHATTVVAPYTSRMILRREDGVWRVSEAEHELANASFPVHVPRSAPGAFASKWDKPLADIRSTPARAEPLYQVYLNALSDTVHRKDFDGWCALFTLPHQVHYDAADHMVEQPEDVRPFFELICEKMDENGATELRRIASAAEFVSADTIFGYHDTYMMKGEEVVFGPIKSRMILRLCDAGWKCSSVTNSLSNTEFPGDAFFPTEFIPTLREIQARMRKP